MGFFKKPINKLSLQRRKPVFGVGINDAEYMITVVLKGIPYHCEAYRAWGMMLRRSYDPYYLNKHPSYIDVYVCDNWLLFSNFERWYVNNKIEGCHLDKDIKIKGSKVYSPVSCMFIPQALNKILTDRARHRGDYPLGVHFNKNNKRYVARVCIKGERCHLGTFKTPEQAHQAYKIAKNKVIEQAMLEYPEFAEYLPQHMFPL